MTSSWSDQSVDVTVIVAQYGNHKLTERVLERIRKFEQHRVELVVVDDGSPESFPGTWERRFRARIVRQEHRGTTAAWNRGAAAARGRVLVFFNNDVEIGGPFLSRLTAPLRSDGCRLTGTAFRRERSVPAELLTGQRSDVLEGWCLAIPADDFRSLGGFDSRFHLYFSDTDLQWRIQQPGCNSRALQAVPGLPLDHAGHATTRLCPKRRTIWERDRAAFIQKWTPQNIERPHGRRPFHLVQVCNVGTILGGTGACAWTVTRALPDWRHTVVFLSPVNPMTCDAFKPASVHSCDTVGDVELSRMEPDLVLMHNTPAARVGKEPLTVPSINYVHACGTPFPADRLVSASRWLKDRHAQRNIAAVLYQGVPVPPRRERTAPIRSLREEIVVGRLCTPTRQKWPTGLAGWYRELAESSPGIRWEFVGCPQEMHADLRSACGGRAVFHPAGLSSRGYLWEWDVLLYHHPHLTESFGRTCAEAMRAGCIPVVDDRGGFREQLIEGTGFLCAGTDAFRSALAALRDPGERRRRSRRCRAYADEAFGLATFRAALLRQFSAVID